MKRLGPELKMPDLKVPLVVKDLYWDLYDRRLLPLVVLVVVAIAAVPFVLRDGSEESPGPTAEETAGLSALGDANPAASLTVVEAKPGLRDYRKRLAHRRPTNPFKQRFTGPQVSGAQLESTSTSSTSLSSESTTTTTTTSGGSTEAGGGESTTPSTEPTPGGTSPSGGDGDGKSGLVFYTFAIKVRIVKSGGKEPDSKQEPMVKERILPLTPLPGEKAPVVTYMGASVGTSEKGKALLMVSTDVKSVFGEAKCVSGDDICQLIEVEPGLPVTFVYGYNEVHYTVNVLKVYPVVTGRS